MGAPKQTIGYIYYMALQMGICRGPVNEIAEIRVGDVTAIDTPICVSDGGQLVDINKPDLFGGEKKEGGINGLAYVYPGHGDQELQGPLTFAGKTLPGLAATLGGDVPSFRGMLTVWYDGEVCAMNPYPKEWSFRVRRTTAGWWMNDCWYPAKATIIMQDSDGNIIIGMNGAHILYEINTNPEWGRGMPAELIDENSYVYAADQLCNERFGLCLPWFRQESIKDFIPVIIDHIGAAQYLDPETGKMTLKLIRNDYALDDLPIFGPDTGLLEVLDDDASGEDTAFNEIIVTGFDPVRKEDISIRVQNLAAIQSQGEIISNTIQYKGIPHRDLLARVAQRELKAQTPLRRLTLVMDRRAWRITPGMPFRIQFPSRGIADMVVRAGEIAAGTLIDGKIQIKVVQDIFGMPETSFVTPTNPVWTPPDFTATVPPQSRLLEVNYRDYYRRSEPADQDALNEGTSYVAMVAKKPPNVQTQGYDIATKTGSDDYEVWFNGGFTAWLTLADDIGPLDTTLDVEMENIANFEAEFIAGFVVQIGDEQIGITAFDFEYGIATIKRGVADTIPAAHVAGDTLWLVDDEMVSDGREYQDGETVYAKALTRTSTDLLALDDAVETSVEVDQRVFRPYPPGNVQQDGVSVYLSRDFNEEPTITWTHRDRVVQADTVVGHEEGSVGPEPGTTYTIRVYDETGLILFREHTGISGTSWQYDDLMQYDDGSPIQVVMRLWSVRDDLESHFGYSFPVVLTGGYGYTYGLDYGGA